jgi:serine/threonine protein kinase
MEDTLTAGQSDTFVGTIGYMPHEQLYGKATPPSISLPYSLGVTVLFLLTGKEPFQFKLKDMRLDYASVVKIPSAFKRLINGMIEPNLAKRIKSAKEALKILAKEKYREEREKELTQRTERQKRELKEDIQDADLGRWVDKKLKKKRLAQEKKERKKQERDQRLMKQADASPQQVFIIEEKGSSLLKVQKISILGMLLHAVKNPTFTHIMLLICLCVFIPIYVEARGFFDPTSNPLIDWITGTAVIISLYIFFIVSVGRGKTFYIFITDNNKLLAYYRNPKWPFFVGNVSGLKIWKHYSGGSHGGFVQDTKAWNSFTFEFGETRNVEILVNGMNKADSARIQGFVHRHGIRTD